MSALILNEFQAPKICGDDCKYEDSYLLIEQEVDKDYSVTQDTTDWVFVYDNCIELLENKTKDLKLFSWWIYSYWKRYEWIGLEEKLDLFNNILEKFGTELFPKSIKGKRNIFYWLDESLSSEIVNYNKGKNLSSNYTLFYNLFLKLDLNIQTILQDENRNFKKILDFLKPYFEEEEKNKEKDSLETNIEEKKNLVQDNLNEINDDADAIKILSLVKKYSSMLSKYYRNKDFKDLRALRISRFLSWLETDGLPYADGKKTFLYPPAELELDEINSLFQEKKYEEALCLAEEIIEVSPFWIDGHHLVFNIFEKTNNLTLANEIKNNILSFVKTNDGILDFTFTDDTPFASNRVKKWINNELLNYQNESNNEDEGLDSNENEIDLIYELANNGEVKEAMKKLSKAYETSLSIEEKFNWRLHHAQLAVEFDKKDIALALLEDLLFLIDKFNLDEWSPKLVSKVYSTILSSFTNMDMEPEKLEKIYKKLCKTDINSAFEIELK